MTAQSETQLLDPVSLENKNGDDVLISGLGMKKIPNRIYGLTRYELLDRCAEIYEKDGPEALLVCNLIKNESLYTRLYRFGITQRKMLKKLGAE